VAKALAKYRESPFNVLRPEGVTNGQFLRTHVAVDPNYHGGKLPKSVNGGRWSAKEWGFEKYDRDRQMWHGAPGPLKARVIGGVLSAGGAADEIGGRYAEE